MLFPFFGLIADCFLFNDIPFSFGNIASRVVENPIHFIIFSAPIVLGITFYFIGKAVESRENINAELARKNKAIKSNNDMLDTFNYHVSHDLKTVLNNQLTLSHMIEKYSKLGEMDKVEEVSKRLTNSAVAGLKTVHDFLKISEDGFVETGAELIALNVPNEIARILDEYDLVGKVVVKIKTVEFKDLLIGKKVFESILLNLTTNAIKYNDRKPVVNVYLKQRAETKLLVFQDNGIGIDLNKDGSKLFKPFNRIENNKKTEGSGIGLFLIKKMLNTMGNEIAVESKLDEGTTFTISFYE